MNIISYGHIKPKRITCNGCGAKLEYVQSDVQIKVTTLRQYTYVICPVCKNAVVFKEF